MRKSIALFAILMLVLVSVFSINQLTVVAADDQAVMKINDAISLVHPRRGMQMTAVGDQIWVTGGLAYESHATYGKGKYAAFTSNPNIEIIDLKAQTCTYTNIATGGNDYYKSTAFKTSDEAPSSTW